MNLINRVLGTVCDANVTPASEVLEILREHQVMLIRKSGSLEEYASPLRELKSKV